MLALLIVLSCLGYLVVGWVICAVMVAMYPHRRYSLPTKNAWYMTLVPLWPALAVWLTLCLTVAAFRWTVPATSWLVHRLNPELAASEWDLP